MTPRVLTQVTGLKAGTSYVFRLRAQNLAGVGKASAVLGPILAQTRPGECDCYATRTFSRTIPRQGKKVWKNKENVYIFLNTDTRFDVRLKLTFIICS